MFRDSGYNFNEPYRGKNNYKIVNNTPDTVTNNGKNLFKRTVFKKDPKAQKLGNVKGILKAQTLNYN